MSARKLQGEIDKCDNQIRLLNDYMKTKEEHSGTEMLKEMLLMEKFCKSAGFTQEMIDALLAQRKPIVCSGKLYSTQYRQSFQIKDAVCKIEDDLTDNHKLVLTINRQPISEWFKEQFVKLKHGFQKASDDLRKGGGFKL